MANSFSWVKRDSSPLRDMAFCRLDWAVRGLYDALYMLSIDLVQVGAEAVSSPLGRAEEIAWHLRTELEFVEWGLGQLEAIGYVAQQDGQWRLTRAEEEQRPSEGSERMAALRKRQKTGRYNTVTNRHNGGDELSRDTDTDKDKDTDRERERDTDTEQMQIPAGAAAEQPGSENIFRVYEQNIGIVTPMLVPTLTEAEKTYPMAWIRDAFGEAVAHNARNWRYVEAILKRWQAQGRGPVTQGGARAPAQGGRVGVDTSALDALIGGVACI